LNWIDPVWEVYSALCVVFSRALAKLSQLIAEVGDLMLGV
jgi:hypothetical protein